MKPAFAVCSTEKVKYRDGLLENHPINLSLCYSIKKDRYSWYPDNEGIPSIVFGILDKDISHKWVYQTEALRDKDYDKLLEGAINCNEIN